METEHDPFLVVSYDTDDGGLNTSQWCVRMVRRQRRRLQDFTQFRFLRYFVMPIFWNPESVLNPNPNSNSEF